MNSLASCSEPLADFLDLIPITGRKRLDYGQEAGEDPASFMAILAAPTAGEARGFRTRMAGNAEAIFSVV